MIFSRMNLVFESRMCHRMMTGFCLLGLSSGNDDDDDDDGIWMLLLIMFMRN